MATVIASYHRDPRVGAGHQPSKTASGPYRSIVKMRVIEEDMKKVEDTYQFAGIAGAVIFGAFCFLLILTFFAALFAISGLVGFVAGTVPTCQPFPSTVNGHEVLSDPARQTSGPLE